ncbi:MAG: cupin domain-containing protein [Deltaproteobacteria bacterium]|nr:cupin domain-containing protein [Deltaproteobacteria bacterium]
MEPKDRPKSQIFSLKTPLLSQGQTNTPLAGTDLLKVRVKVYAEGGENALHAHFDEDHSFVILQGQATFHDDQGNTQVVNKYEGILLPKGAYYYFQSTGDENLVLLRVGAGRKPGDDFRLGKEGRPLTAEENKRIAGVPIPGKFFGA